jgi:ArsR family transcriptional regulator, arsenate/arsenite/antimonite-responsive transcriptional repressor
LASRRIDVVEENGARTDRGEGLPEERVESLVALGRALSDPIRVRMLGIMAEAASSGRGCCDLPDLGVPAEEGDIGLCVCEFEDRFGMGQSKVSYHMRKLKEAGLVSEEKRGKWSFYSLDGEAARELLGGLGEHLGVHAGSITGV